MTEKDGPPAIGIAPGVAEWDGRAVGRGGAVLRRRARPECRDREHRRGSQFFIQPALPRSRLASAAAGEIIKPGWAIVDPHHHLWDCPGEGEASG